MYLLAWQVRVTVGDSGLCCCVCDAFRALIISHMCGFCTTFLVLDRFQIAGLQGYKFH